MDKEREPNTVDLEDFQTEQMILVRYDEGILILDHYRPYKGRTLKQMAKESRDKREIGMQPVRVGVGYISVGDERIRVRTPQIEILGGITFIDAEVFTLDDIKALDIEDYKKKNLIKGMRGNNIAKSVRTRTGKWQDFNEGDTVISSNNGVKK